MTDYALVDASGLVVGIVGVTNNHIESFVPPEGQTPVAIDDQHVAEGWTYQNGQFVAPPPPPPSPPPTSIPTLAFFNRFTPAEQAAIWAATIVHPEFGVGLTNGLAAGSVNLLDEVVKTWMDGLVAVGAITADREALILTP